jgi:hypothetical protein
MNTLGQTHIDYFSLDVEGAEMIILQSIDWKHLDIDVFTIETMNVILGTVLLIQAFFIKQLRSFPIISSYVYGFASTNNPDHPRSFSKNKEFENDSPS